MDILIYLNTIMIEIVSLDLLNIKILENPNIIMTAIIIKNIRVISRLVEKYINAEMFNIT